MELEEVRGSPRPLGSPQPTSGPPQPFNSLPPCKRARRSDLEGKPFANDEELLPLADDILNFVTSRCNRRLISWPQPEREPAIPIPICQHRHAPPYCSTSPTIRSTGTNLE